MNEIKTILLIGRTGNGKSTLANVISGTSRFTESEFAVSETRKIVEDIFEYKGVKYQIIDTVGIGDTKLTLDKVLRKLALMGHSVKDGLHQILFVTDGKISEEAKSTYDLLRKVVFDGNIARYTTVVRTRFASFMNEEKCAKDKDEMSKISKGLEELIGECKRLVHVDNPPLIGNKKEIKLSEERRNKSRELLMKHLESVCKNTDKYRPINLIILNSEIGRYVTGKKEIKNTKKGNLERSDGVSLGEKETKNDNKDSKFVLAGVVKMKNIWDENNLKNKITEAMLERVGDIDLGLKEGIRKELEELKTQKEKDEESPAKWKFIIKKTGAISKKIGEVGSSISKLTQHESGEDLKRIKVLEKKK